MRNTNSSNYRLQSFDPTAAREEFLRRMRSMGLDPGRIVADGKIHEVKTSAGKVWYVYHEKFDEAHGAFGNYRTAGTTKLGGWSSRSKNVTSLSPREADAIRRAPDPEAEAEQERRDAQRRQARRLLWYCREEDPDHRYLKRKSIDPHGVCVFYGRKIINGLVVYGALAVPVLDDDERPQGIQFITEDGDKRNLGPTSKGHFWIGQPSRGRTLCIAEGFATAASVFEDTGYRCCVCFGHSGFLHVAQYVRKKFDPRKLIIVADGDDVSVKSASAAARATDALIWIAAKNCDYNDMVNGVRA